MVEAAACLIINRLLDLLLAHKAGFPGRQGAFRDKAQQDPALVATHRAAAAYAIARAAGLVAGFHGSFVPGLQPRGLCLGAGLWGATLSG